MILVDSSVWIDLFANRTSLEVLALKEFIASEQRVVVGDLILIEVLQGARSGRHADELLHELGRFDSMIIAGKQVAIAGAAHYRFLRGRGVTVRKTIDSLIATRCILNAIPLLYSDRDFDPFVEHLNLRPALPLFSGTA